MHSSNMIYLTAKHKNHKHSQTLRHTCSTFIPLNGVKDTCTIILRTGRIEIDVFAIYLNCHCKH